MKGRPLTGFEQIPGRYDRIKKGTFLVTVQWCAEICSLSSLRAMFFGDAIQEVFQSLDCRINHSIIIYDLIAMVVKLIKRSNNIMERSFNDQNIRFAGAQALKTLGLFLNTYFLHHL